MKYRKRPIIVEAEQWFPPGDHRHKPIEGVEFSAAHGCWFADWTQVFPGELGSH